MYHTAAGLRSHLKNFVMETYKLNLADPIVFPKWNDWWKAYKGEVLKPNGKMKVCSSMFSKIWLCQDLYSIPLISLISLIVRTFVKNLF